MPYTAKRPCSQPGCPELVNKGYCDKHRKLRDKQRRNQRGKQLYKTARWQRFRRMALSRHPVCQVDGCNKFATDVDHIKAVAAGGEEWSMHNIQCLCHSCHSRKTVIEDGGLVGKFTCNPNEYQCGICGKMAWTMYVYGFRCKEHENVREPKQCDVGSRVIGVYGKKLKVDIGRCPTNLHTKGSVSIGVGGC